MADASGADAELDRRGAGVAPGTRPSPLRWQTPRLPLKVEEKPGGVAHPQPERVGCPHVGFLVSPPQSLCFQVYDDVILVALGVSPPNDSDWSRFVEQAGRAMMQGPRPILVVSEGGLPSASQRDAMDQKLPPAGVLTAVITDSPVTRGAVTDALRHLRVDPSRDAAIFSVIPRICNIVASGPSPLNYNGDIFNALDDDGRLWGRFWTSRNHDGLSVLAPVKGDGSHDDVTFLLQLSVVQTTAELTIDLTFWQPNLGWRGSTKTGGERWTAPDLAQKRSLDLTFAGRAWGRLVVDGGRWMFLDPQGRTRLELTPATDATNPFTLRRGDAPVLRVAAFGPDGQPLRPMTALHP